MRTRCCPTSSGGTVYRLTVSRQSRIHCRPRFNRLCRHF
jgi:hypothetical protein